MSITSAKQPVAAAVRCALHCHCSMCRKAHGAAFRSRARIRATDFRWVQGEELVTYYEPSPGNHRGYQSSPGVIRTFCKRCGSTLQFISDKRPSTFALALGTLDDDPGVETSLHIFVGSRAPWFRITDAIDTSA